MKVLMANSGLDKPIMMLVGGSSTYYGYISTYLEELLDNEYFVLNCGTNAGMCGFLFMEGLAPYLREGDVIINAPEYGNVQFGTFDITWRTILATESCYNLYRNVDFSKYTGLFSSLSYYNKTYKSEGYKGKDYHVTNKSMTYPNCDMAGVREYRNELYPGVGISKNHLTDERISNFNWLNRHLTELGIHYWMSCAPVYEIDAPNDEALNDYYLFTNQVLDCDVISNPKDHVYKKELYYDQQYHHTTEGALERTKRVAEDIKLHLSSGN
jgi:hypothetical protein